MDDYSLGDYLEAQFNSAKQKKYPKTQEYSDFKKKIEGILGIEIHSKMLDTKDLRLSTLKGQIVFIWNSNPYCVYIGYTCSLCGEEHLYPVTNIEDVSLFVHGNLTDMRPCTLGIEFQAIIKHLKALKSSSS